MPHSDGTKTEHGFASLIQMPGAGLGLAWLDGRAMKTGGSDDAHGSDAGAMSVRFATFSRDWRRTSEMLVDLRVCECCSTTAHRQAVEAVEARLFSNWTQMVPNGDRAASGRDAKYS